MTVEPLRRTRGKPTEVDVYVGRQVRQRRQLLGLSQTKLAEALNITFQQVQKYERGSNRVGAGRLYQLATVLDVPVGYFFEQMGDAVPADAGIVPPGVSRETAEMLRDYAVLPARLQRQVRMLVAAVAGRAGGPAESPARSAGTE